MDFGKKKDVPIRRALHVVLFIMLYTVALIFKGAEIKAAEKHYDIALFITLYKMVINWTSVKETLV